MDSSPKLDEESQRQLTDSEEVARMLKSAGWQIVEQKLKDKILDVQNIHNIDESNLAVDLKARIMCAKMLFEWMKDDIYGFVEQAEANLRKPEDAPDDYISRR